MGYDEVAGDGQSPCYTQRHSCYLNSIVPKGRERIDNKVALMQALE